MALEMKGDTLEKFCERTGFNNDSLGYLELLVNHYALDIKACNEKLSEWGRPKTEFLGA